MTLGEAERMRYALVGPEHGPPEARHDLAPTKLSSTAWRTTSPTLGLWPKRTRSVSFAAFEIGEAWTTPNYGRSAGWSRETGERTCVPRRPWRVPHASRKVALAGLFNGESPIENRKAQQDHAGKRAVQGAHK